MTTPDVPAAGECVAAFRRRSEPGDLRVGKLGKTRAPDRMAGRLDPAIWVRALLVRATGVVSMAVMACAIALVRDTTGHEWYAAGKLTFTEILIEAGFDDRAPTE